MNRRHFRRRLSFVGASLAGLGFGRGSATQQPPGPRSSPPRSFAGPPRAGAAPSRAAAVSGPPRAAASAASARAPPRTTAPAAMSGRTATGAGPAADPYGFRAAGSRSAPGIADLRLLATTGRRAARYRRTLELRARRAARRLPRKPRNASGNARRRRIAADEHRAPVFGAAICRTPLRAREGRRRTSDAANARARRRRPADSSRRRRLTLSPRSPDSIAPSQ